MKWDRIKQEAIWRDKLHRLLANKDKEINRLNKLLTNSKDELDYIYFCLAKSKKDK